MADTTSLTDVFSAPPHFKIHEVDRKHEARHLAEAAAAPAVTLAPNLGPLVAFAGTWTGQGFNTIFRPDSLKTPTPLPHPVTGSDNVLELNLTQETLSFSPSLGSVPNRGTAQQADIFLNAVPYLQTISDVTVPPANGIHFEPGMWLSVPSTTNPNEPPTLVRMASIPHGTTVVAQGILLHALAGKPTIDPIDITPFTGGKPLSKIPFPSQQATQQTTPRIPQDLTQFIAAGTITQPILDDPNTILRNQIKHQNITETLVIGISTHPGAPLFGGPLPAGATPTTPPPAIAPSFGGGPANIAFLLGVPNPPPTAVGPNAESLQMDAVFWIETVTYEIAVPPIPAGSPPVVLKPVQTNPPVPLQPSFVAAIPFVPNKKFAGGTITMKTTQIQYSQKVILNFNSLSWPHASVASLVPADPIPIPSNLLPLT